MALDNIMTQLQPANSGTLYDIGVFANRVFLGNDLDDDNTLANMLSRYITTDNNCNINLDGYGGDYHGSIISKGYETTVENGTNLQSLLFTDMVNTYINGTAGIGGLKNSLIFGRGFSSNIVMGLTNSFIFGYGNIVRTTHKGNSAIPNYSTFHSVPLLENCGIIGENTRIEYDNDQDGEYQGYSKMAKNSLIVGYNNSLINDAHYNNLTLENSLIVGNNNTVENEGYVKNTLCFGKNNAITQTGVVLGEGLVQPNVQNGVVIGAYNSRNALRDFMFEVGIGTSEQNRKTGFGIGKENDIYIYGPDGNYFVLKATSRRLTLTAYDNLGVSQASTNLIQW